MCFHKGPLVLRYRADLPAPKSEKEKKLEVAGLKKTLR